MRRLALPIGLALGVLALCSIPGVALPRVRLLSADKLAHIVMFAVIGWVWLRAFPDRFWTVCFAGAAFAVFTEVWQDRLPIGRTGDPADAAADIIGLAMAAAVWAFVRRRTSSAPVASSSSR